jgi:hypothetical protein
MNKSKLFTFLLISTLQILVMFHLHIQVKAQQASKEYKEQTTLYRYLHNIGTTYNCFFTIEEGWDLAVKEPRNQLESYIVENSVINPNIEQRKTPDISVLLDELRQSIPNLTFEVDQQRPNIIHIIDARLKKQKRYGLDSVLMDFTFKGDVEELLKAINKQEKLVTPTTTFGNYEALYVDFSSKVKVQGTHLLIRDALSNFISLKDRSRILWIARTRLDQDATTNVHFIGAPKRKNDD